MRILYLCHRIPFPPDKGDKIRAFHQIRALAKTHEVDLFTLADDPRDLAHRDTLAAYCRQVTVKPIRPKLARLRSLPYLLTGMPLTVPYFFSAELASVVHGALSRGSYDRIFVYCSAMAQYVKSVERIPIVMDLVDVDSDKWMQYAARTRFPFSAVYRREGKTLQAYERSVCEKAGCVLVSTEREAQLARAIAPKARVHVLPNGVDTEYFTPAAQGAATDPAIIFTGDMSYFPNEEAVGFFADEVLPLIRREIGTVRFLIVGRNPGRKVRELRKINGIEVTGFVPDIREWLSRANVAVAPFKIAAGIQNKILEAMACGLPVVATPRAAQGLSRRVADIVQTADSPEEFASSLVVLLRNPQLAKRTGLDGRRVVAEDYRWEDTADQLLKLVEHPGKSRVPHVEKHSSRV